MYCVIQEIKTKKIGKGKSKELKVSENTFTINGQTQTTYDYYYGEECFIRDQNKAYRISIHESYRENGKVRKRQVYICTIGYYDLIDFGDYILDYITNGRRGEILQKLKLSEEDLLDLIYEKFQPVADQVKAEYAKTEEYRVTEKHESILKAYRQAMDAFLAKYEVDRTEYKRCYDIFGTLRNAAYLEKIKKDHQARKEYERTSRSYYEKYSNNYNSSQSGGASDYDDADKVILKQFYRELSKKFHPDANPDHDTSEQMKVLNRLKNDWCV